MMIQTSIILVVLAIAFLAYIISLVARKRLLLKYSLLWMLLSIALIACAVFPEPIFALAKLVGIETPSNFVFIVAIGCLLLICLSLSVIASKQTAHSKTLVQEVAILNDEIDKLRNQND